MKTVSKFVLFLCTLVSVYYLAVWSHVFNSYPTHQERVERFSRYFFNASSVALTVGLLVATVVSIGLALNIVKKPAWLLTFVVSFQGLMGCFYLWQLL